MKRLVIIIVGIILAILLLISRKQVIDTPDYVDPNPNQDIASVNQR